MGFTCSAHSAAIDSREGAGAAEAKWSCMRKILARVDDGRLGRTVAGVDHSSAGGSGDLAQRE